MEVRGALLFTLTVLCFHQGASADVGSEVSGSPGHKIQRASRSVLDLTPPSSGLSLFGGDNAKRLFSSSLFKGSSPSSPYGSHALLAGIINVMLFNLKALQKIPGTIFDVTTAIFITIPLKVVVDVVRLANTVASLLGAGLGLPLQIVKSILRSIPGVGIFITPIEWLVMITLNLPAKLFFGAVTQTVLQLALVPAAFAVQASNIFRSLLVGAINLPVTLMIGYKTAALSVIKWWSGYHLF